MVGCVKRVELNGVALDMKKKHFSGDALFGWDVGEWDGWGWVERVNWVEWAGWVGWVGLGGMGGGWWNG